MFGEDHGVRVVVAVEWEPGSWRKSEGWYSEIERGGMGVLRPEGGESTSGNRGG